MDREAWRELANCKEIPTDLFFPERGEEISEVALAACAECPVRIQCADYAIANREPGIWGGTTERTRRKARAVARSEGRAFDRRLRPINHGTDGGYATHLRRGEQACASCVLAHRQVYARYRSEAS